MNSSHRSTTDPPVPSCVPEEAPFVLVVPSRMDGLRLGQVLARQIPGLSRNTFFRLLSSGKILINGEGAQEDVVLRPGTAVTVFLRRSRSAPLGRLAAIEVLHEDDRYLVINKPAGEVVVPDRQRAACPLLDAVTRHMQSTGGPEARPKVIHRLDRDTTGVLVLGKTLDAKRWLTEEFSAQRVQKKYLAIVQGEVRPESGTVDLRIGPASQRSTKMMASAAAGRSAVTHYRALETFSGYTLVELSPETGRTHQVRVHLAALGYPLAVDPLYGTASDIRLSQLKSGYRPGQDRPETPIMDRLTLHAMSITFQPGPDAATISVEAPVPDDFTHLLKVLRKYRRKRG